MVSINFWLKIKSRRIGCSKKVDIDDTHTYKKLRILCCVINNLGTVVISAKNFGFDFVFPEDLLGVVGLAGFLIMGFAILCWFENSLC